MPDTEPRQEDTDDLHFGPYHFDPKHGQLFRNGLEIPLPPRSVELLHELLVQQGKIVAKDTLIAAGWNGTYVSDSSLSEAINRIRGALGDSAREPTYIATVHGRGYKFICPVTAGSGNGAEAATLPAADSAPSIEEVRSTDTTGGGRSGWAVFVTAAVLLMLVAWWWRQGALNTAPRFMTTRLIAHGSDMTGEGRYFSALSPDGMRLAYRRGGQLWLLDLRTGEAARLTGEGQPETDSGQVDGFPVWSRDGRRIAYEWHDRTVSPPRYQIRTVAAVGGAPVIAWEASSSFPRAALRDWSPADDSLLVALVVADLATGSFELAEVPIRVGEPRRIGQTVQAPQNGLANANRILRAAYSPEGDRIAVPLREGDRKVLYVMERSGARRVALSGISPSDDFPVWSPDGRVLLFRRYDGGSAELLALELDGLQARGAPAALPLTLTAYVEPRQWSSNGQLAVHEGFFGSAIHRLPVDPETGTATGPAGLFTEWLGGDIGARIVPSHDGDTVLAAARFGVTHVPYLVGRDQSESLPWPSDFRNAAVLPVGWGPDDGFVVLGGTHADGVLAFHRVQVDGGGVAELARAPDADFHASYAALRRDGVQVVLERGPRSATSSEVRPAILDLGSGEIRELGIEGTIIKSAWSPDGARLAIAQDDGIYRLMIAPLDGEDTFVLEEFEPGVRLSAPTWSPEGDYLAFRYLTDRATEIQVIPSTGGARRVVYQADPAAGHIRDVHWSADGSWIYFSRGSTDERLNLVENFIDTTGPEIVVASAQPAQR